MQDVQRLLVGDGAVQVVAAEDVRVDHAVLVSDVAFADAAYGGVWVEVQADAFTGSRGGGPR
ncbi:hypothetical protein, partial [Rhodococcus aetherivorans]|uniref:hypothetical protein n=1 Tax=Rhodococcus aetherivorans TaxID=191292 RepID=UPI0031E5F309